MGRWKRHTRPGTGNGPSSLPFLDGPLSRNLQVFKQTNPFEPEPHPVWDSPIPSHLISVQEAVIAAELSGTLGVEWSRHQICVSVWLYHTLNPGSVSKSFFQHSTTALRLESSKLWPILISFPWNPGISLGAVEWSQDPPCHQNKAFPCLGSLSPSLPSVWHYRGMRNLRDGRTGKFWSLEARPWRGLWDSSSLFSLSHILASMKWEVLCHHKVPTVMYCLP